jgi:hypothetical protein
MTLQVKWAQARRTAVMMNLSELRDTSRLMSAVGARSRRHPLHGAHKRVDRALARRMRALRRAKGGTK